MGRFQTGIRPRSRFSHQACGAKAQVVYDADDDRPTYAAVTPANVNDITAAKAMPIEPGATYVFDLGYYDFGWWAKMDKVGCRIATRVKSHTPLAVTREQAVDEAGPILFDRIGLPPVRQAMPTSRQKSSRKCQACLRTSVSYVSGLYIKAWDDGEWRDVLPNLP
ncbi:Transposase DDE domain family protein [Rhizobium leguminosarum]|uniref:Transposase DDE domain family protein n=1 Tax=Rhizobium leguminosarum TaxID=384 RepID=A0A2Z4YME5_RHILE|nr:Transposase DDE domain family protein [Rhizobium leguminosarum]